MPMVHKIKICHVTAPPRLAHAPGHSDDMETHTDTSASTELPVAVLVEGKTPRHSRVRSRYLYHAARHSQLRLLVTGN